MPDWFYRTLAQPLLFSWPANLSRRFTLGYMGAVGRAPLRSGAGLIDLLGHANPPAGMASRLGTLDVSGPVGASCRFDGAARALAAWSRFGFGIVELGPTWVGGAESDWSWGRDDARKELRTRGPTPPLSPELLRRRAAAVRGPRPRFVARIRPPSGTTLEALIDGFHATVAELGETIDAHVLDLKEVATGWARGDWERLANGLREPLDAGRLWLRAPAEHASCEHAASGGFHIWLIERSSAPGNANEPTPDENRARGPEAIPELVGDLRRIACLPGGGHRCLVAGAVCEPADARTLIEAGAAAILIDSGMVFGGPGLPKRCNELLAPQAPPLQTSSEPIARQGWVWGLLLGVAMLLGGLLAFVLSADRVLLPYDEVFCGLTRAEVRQINPRILSFMAHDRVTLAGTMLSIGLLYVCLSYFGIRRGLAWARTALLASAGVGFASFFLFLGFGYFDPFHGFVTAILFQMFLLALVCRTVAARPCAQPEPRETRVWRIGLWGQLLLILHAAGLIGAGLGIAGIGVLDVFVPSDLRYLSTSIAELEATSVRLIPLIAHDRATLGGMLLASGVPFLLAALWGIGRGTRWLLLTLAGGGILAYASTLGVHFAIGYTDFVHLLPAWLGLGLLTAGTLLAWPWTSSRQARQT